MSLPAGVTSFELIFGKTFDFEGTALRTDLVITPSHELVWEATGDRLVPIKVSKDAEENEFGSVHLPHTDQAGFVDLSGNAITDWWYTVQSTDRKGRTSASGVKIRKVQVTSDIDTVDLDLIPIDGVVGPVGSVVPPAVTSVNGATGAVVVEGVTDAGVAALVTGGGATEAALSATIAGVVTTTPEAGSSTGYLSWKGSEVGSVPVVKPLGDGRSGVWEMTHNDTTGYLFHLLTGSSMGHSQALIALGIDNDGIGLLIPNKDNGRAIVGDQRATVADSAAYWMHVTQRSTAAPLIRLEQQAAGVAPLIQLLNFTGFSGRLLDIVNADGAVGNIQGDTGIMIWQRDVRVQDRADATASYIRLDSGSGASSTTMKMSYHGDDEDVFFGNTGAGGGYYPYKFAHSSSSFAIQTAATITGKGILPLPADVGAYTTQISVSHSAGVSLAAGALRAAAGVLGFYGATASAQPAAVANATDAATVITQLNALLARLRTIGLIAT